MADEKNPFAEELAKRDNENPFAAEIQKRQRANMSGADIAWDVALQAGTGINKGVAEVVTAPWRIVDWAGEKLTGGDFLPNMEDTPLWSTYLKPPPAASKAGEYTRSAGEVIGSSLLPEAAILTRAQQLGSAALRAPAQTTGQSVGRAILEPYATAPRAAVGMDIVAATGAGLGEHAAKDMGFGPTGQMIGGILGSVTPFGAKAIYDVPAGYVREARHGATPHAKVASYLAEDGTTLDDLALQTSVGSTRNAPTHQQQQNYLRTMDILGQEMIRNGGDAALAIDATAARLVQDLGITDATARAWMRRMTAAQSDNPLLLGEYPSVMGSNERTRTLSTQGILDEMDRISNDVRNPQQAIAARRAVDPGLIEDSNTQWLLDTMANSGGGTGTANVRRTIDARLDVLGDMVRHRVRDWAPGMTQDAEAAIENMRRLAAADYRNIYNNPAGTPVNYSMLHGLLPRVIDRNINRMGGYNAEQADALRQAINQIYATRPAGVAARQALPGLEDQVAQLRMQIKEARRQRLPRDQIDNMSRQADQLSEQLRLERRDATPPTQQHLLLTLEQLQNSRSAIRGMLDGYRADPSKRHLLPVVEPLYDDLTRLMTRASPEWARVNRSWADMNLARVAQELGQNLSDKASPQFRQQMRDFNRLNPVAQDFVAMELAQQFDDAVRNAGRGDNVAKFFKTPHIRELIRTVYGDDAAVDMLRMSRDLNVAAKSKNMMHGSPTGPRAERAKRLNSDLNLIAEADIPTSVDQFFQKLKQYTVGRMIDRRNAGIANIITTPVSNVPAMAEQIARMRQAQDLAARYAGPRTLLGGVGNSTIQGARVLPGAATTAYTDDK